MPVSGQLGPSPRMRQREHDSLYYLIVPVTPHRCSRRNRQVLSSGRGGATHDMGYNVKKRCMARGRELGDVTNRICISASHLAAMEGLANLKVCDKGYLGIYANLPGSETQPLPAMYDHRKYV